MQDTLYLLSHDSSEVDRLTRQHARTLQGMGRSSSLPPSIQLQPGAMVMDVAAGCCAWTLHLIQSLKEDPVCGSSGSDPVKFFACDISLDQFPSSSTCESLGLQVFQQDVTQSFPEEHKGRFDVVTMRTVVLALTKHGWDKALANLRELLKPGGRLILLEPNMRLYHPDSSTKTWQYRPDDEDELPHWSAEMNHVIRRSILEPNGYLVDPVYRLPSLLRMPSWSISSHTPFYTPVGKLCKTFKGPHGESFTDDAAASVSTFVLGFQASFPRIVAHSPMEGQERLYSTTEEANELITNFSQHAIEEGGLLAWAELVAVKNAVNEDNNDDFVSPQVMKDSLNREVAVFM